MWGRRWASAMALSVLVLGFVATSDDDWEDTDTSPPPLDPLQIVEAPAVRITPDAPLRRFAVRATGRGERAAGSIILQTQVSAEAEDEVANVTISIEDCDTNAVLSTKTLGLSVGVDPVPVEVSYAGEWSGLSSYEPFDQTWCIAFSTADHPARFTWEQGVEIDGVALPFELTVLPIAE